MNKVADEIAAWIEGKCQRAWRMDLHVDSVNCKLNPGTDHSINVTSHRDENAEIRDFEWIHPDDDETDTAWTNSVTLARDNETVAFSIAVKISSLQFVVRPVTFTFGRPRIVTQLLGRYDCFIDGWRIPTGIRFIAADGVESFVEEDLLSESRRLPVILISADSWSGQALVEPADYHQTLKGLAEIVVLDKWGCFRLTDTLGKDSSCFDGAIRIYWPGFRRDSNPFRHKLFLPNSILRRAESPLSLDQAIFRHLCAIAVTRHVDSRVLSDARGKINSARRQKADALRQAVEQGRLEKDDLTEQLLEALIKNERLQKERDDLQVDLDAQRVAWSQYQPTLEIEDEEGNDLPASSSATEFESVLAAYDQAKEKFDVESGPLAFLDRARETASESPYQNPAHVYAFFQEMHELATRWSENKGKLGQGWLASLRACGFDYKDKISDISKGKYGEEYKFMYLGKKLLFEKHVTLGAKQPQTCLSIHWYLDEKNWKVVIGHCGRHLTNTKS